MEVLTKNKKYPAYTLLELLVVISIFIILGGMTFSSFGGLQNTIKMNEYMLNLEQDIRSVQRASMLLQRNPGEKWIYGLGIDFSDFAEGEVYKTFKWCSHFDDYGDIKTRSNIPAFNPNMQVELSNGYIPTTLGTSSVCDSNVLEGPGSLYVLAGYDRTITLPKSDITFSSDARYILFESVSGRAFFYDSEGALLNYDPQGNILEDSSEIVSFDMTIDSKGKGSIRRISVRNLSGKIDTYMYDR